MTHDGRDTPLGVYEFRSHLAVGRSATAVFGHVTYVTTLVVVLVSMPLLVHMRQLIKEVLMNPFLMV